MPVRVAQLSKPLAVVRFQSPGCVALSGNVRPAQMLNVGGGISNVSLRSGFQKGSLGVELGRGCSGYVDMDAIVCKAGVKEFTQGLELADGDDGGNGGEPPEPKSTDEQDNEGDGRAVLIDALIKAGATLNDLPKDMQAAVKLGAMTVDNLHQFLALSATPILGFLGRTIPAFRDRVLGNPQFLLQLFLELSLGLTAKTVAEFQARGDNMLKELPFVLSDLALEFLGDFSLVWLLSPKTSFKPPSSSGIGSVITKLPGHCLQVGNFTLKQRLTTILYRGSQFFCVGFATSAVGHSITKAAIESGDQPSEDVKLAPVLDNSLGWGSFMMVSSNFRYQSVNFIEESIFLRFLKTKYALAPAMFGLRFTNCFVGGVQWVWFAQKTGLQ